MEVFRRVGERLEARWSAADHDEAAFPRLAVEALEEADEIAKLRATDLLRWIVSAASLPAQRDPRSQFSHLALGLHQASRFSISALFWLDGTTFIHQHAFSGAFRVLQGSSLHCRWRFREERAVNGRFRLGALSLASADLLPTGSIHPIDGGSALVHSLFHLDPLSVTLVVRTESEPGVQWDYVHPGIARDPFLQDVTQWKKCEALGILLALDPAEADPELDELFAAADLELTFHLLRQASRALRIERAADAASDERFEALVRRARARHGAEMERFVETAAWERRQARVLAARRATDDPGDRFLLALLLNVTDRARVLELLAERTPEADPIEAFVEAVARLAGTDDAIALGVPTFAPAHRAVLRRLLAGQEPDAAAADLATADPGIDATEGRARCEEAARALRASPLLGPLLA